MWAMAEFLVAEYQKQVLGYEYIFNICLYLSTKTWVQRQVKWWGFSIVRKKGTEVMFRSIGREHLVCFVLQNQTILKEMSILELASEFQQWQEATRETDSFLKRYKNGCSESLSTSPEAMSYSRVKAHHSHQTNQAHPAWRSSTKTTPLLRPTSSPD